MTTEKIKKLKIRELKNFLKKNFILFKRTSRRYQLEKLAFEFLEKQKEQEEEEKNKFTTLEKETVIHIFILLFFGGGEGACRYL